MKPALNLIEKELVSDNEHSLNKVGLLFRSFSRVKNNRSLEEKVVRKKVEGAPYSVNGKLIQDVIGIRVTTYFHDDIEIVYQVLRSLFSIVGEQIDDHSTTVFKPKRTNIICRIKKTQLEDFEVYSSHFNGAIKVLLDTTFEVQLRTVISEGWHEIDHNMRYKCKDDWHGHVESDRMLNGIYASLETNEIAVKELFERLAYSHYKSNNWNGLLRTKFRLRLQLDELSQKLLETIAIDKQIGKGILKCSRYKIISALYESKESIPISMDNLVYVINCLEMKNGKLLEITPKIIRDEFLG